MELVMSDAKNNEPLDSSDQSKLICFMFLLGVSILYGLTIIPILGIGIGYFLMKKNKDFTSVDVSVKVVLIYFKILFVLSLIAALVFLALSAFAYDNYDFEDYLAGLSVTAALALVSYLYSIATKRLYFNILNEHRGWVVLNGAFRNTEKVENNPASKSGVEILQSEKMKPYSVADELTKWAKLKSDGHISDDEFNEARAKLLNRN